MSEDSAVSCERSSDSQKRRGLDKYKKYVASARKNRSWADVELVSSDEARFPVHRFLVGRMSSVLEEKFRQLTPSDSKSRPQLAVEAPATAVAIIVAFIYSDGILPADIWIPDVPEAQKPRARSPSNTSPDPWDEPRSHYQSCKSKLHSTSSSSSSSRTHSRSQHRSKSELKSRSRSRSRSRGRHQPSSHTRSHRRRRSPISMIVPCVQAALLARKLKISELYDLLWPITMEHIEEQLKTSATEVLEALKICYLTDADYALNVVPIIDLLALRYSTLHEDSEIQHLAMQLPLFSWQLTVRMGKLYEKGEKIWKEEMRTWRRELDEEKAMWVFQHCQCRCCQDARKKGDVQKCDQCASPKCRKKVAETITVDTTALVAINRAGEPAGSAIPPKKSGVVMSESNN